MDLRLSNVALDLPDGRRLFSIPDFQLPTGSHLLLHGASGTGKSTLLHLLAGLMSPTEGDVHFGHRTLSSMTDQERSRLRREHIGLIFQKLNLLTHLTGAENVSLALHRSTKSESADIIAKALKRVRMESFANERTANLSGGEQQRIAVARVLAQSPDVILADEPTSSLDDENASFVIEALKSAAKDKTLLIVSHDDRLVSHFKDRRSLADLSRGPA